MDGVLGGVAALAATIAVAAAVLGLVLYQREIRGRARRLAERVHPPPERVRGRPIERIARDLRRVRAEVLAPAPGTPVARRRGVAQAYDDLLVEACRALAVPDTLSDLPVQHRSAERPRVEDALRCAGLAIGD